VCGHLDDLAHNITPVLQDAPHIRGVILTDGTPLTSGSVEENSIHSTRATSRLISPLPTNETLTAGPLRGCWCGQLTKAEKFEVEVVDQGVIWQQLIAAGVSDGPHRTSCVTERPSWPVEHGCWPACRPSRPGHSAIPAHCHADVSAFERGAGGNR
jgi:hypothetical protein